MENGKAFIFLLNKSSEEKMYGVLVCCILFAVILPRYSSAPGDAYGMISDVQTECEYEALYVGSRLADAYNSYDETVLAIDRIQHEFFRRIPAFSRLVQYELTRKALPGQSYLSTADLSAVAADTSGNNKKAFKGDNKFHHDISHSAFRPLANRWIHFIGDSTLKSWLHSLILPFHAHKLNWNIEEWMREHCFEDGLEKAQKYTGSVSYAESKVYYCESLGYGPHGKLSFELRDSLLENFKPEQLAGHRILNNTDGTAVPDVVVLQVGYAACYESYNSKHGHKVDGAIEDRSDRNVGPLMKSFGTLIQDLHVRQEYQQTHANNSVITHNKPMMIVALAPRNPLQDYHSDVCTWKLNRKVAFEAHRRKFMVFEREEIEGRVLFRNEYVIDGAAAKEPYVLQPHNLTMFPLPQIVTSSFVSLLGCMDANVSFHLF